MPYPPEHLTIREAKVSEAPAIRRLALDVKIDAWSDAGYSDEMLRADSFVLTATANGHLLGFLVARIVPGNMADAPDADLYNIAVDPGAKRCGIGTMLLLALFEELTERGVCNVWLEVRESNHEAISFYEHYGFTAEVTRPNFYVNPTENAVIMRFPITPKRGVSES
ncbi:MAG TPA: ribosomal protein S18-alanine N-acetyltransferase [Pyrinomonadaceae bacterium]|nr:ribosomal protein S18-alanine N-acetyltransferase [Pyrinomonadaceae bacterium]